MRALRQQPRLVPGLGGQGETRRLVGGEISGPGDTGYGVEYDRYRRETLAAPFALGGGLCVPPAPIKPVEMHRGDHRRSDLKTDQAQEVNPS